MKNCSKDQIADKGEREEKKERERESSFLNVQRDEVAHRNIRDSLDTRG